MKYETPAFDVWLDVSRHAGKKAGDVYVAPNATQFLMLAANTVDVGGLWRISKKLRLNAGVANLTDKKVWNWSDVRGLAANSPHAMPTASPDATSTSRWSLISDAAMWGLRFAHWLGFSYCHERTSMNAYPDHGINDPDIDSDIGLSEGQHLPSAEAVLAAALALMTGHAQACCQERRWAMLIKTIANLHLLAHHPGLSPGFRAVADQLHDMWVKLREPSQTPAQQGPPNSIAQPKPPQPVINFQPPFTQPRVLWHASPEILQ